MLLHLFFVSGQDIVERNLFTAVFAKSLHVPELREYIHHARVISILGHVVKVADYVVDGFTNRFDLHVTLKCLVFNHSEQKRP